MAVKTNITINIVEPGSDVPVPDTGLFTHGIGNAETTIIVSAALVTVLVILSIVLTTYMYRKHKKQGRTTKLVHIVDQTKAIIKSKKRISAGLAAISLLASAGTFMALTKNGVNATDADNQAEDGLTVNVSDEELTIEVGDEPVFAVLPVQVTVEEATKAGYTLTAYTDNTDLVSTTNPNNKIPMVTVEGDELTTLEDNTWGLALDNEPTAKDNKVYKALSTDQDNPTIIKTIDDYSETPANDTTTIYYGFYITPDIPYGTYTGGEVEYEAEENKVATVTFDGNGLYFNNDPNQTQNVVKYIPGSVGETKYSHTSNLNDAGEVIDPNNDNGMYPLNTNETFVYDFPGMNKINVKIVESANDAGCNPDLNDYFSIWPGSHADYTAKNNWGSAVNLNGFVNWSWESSIGMSTSGGKTIFYYKYSGIDVDLDGSSVTIAYTTSDSRRGYCGNSGYGYYAKIVGYNSSKEISGVYKTPGSIMPNNFLGWSEDPNATEPTYIDQGDIDRMLSLRSGDTMTLYAVFQKSTVISFDSNGGIGVMEDQVIIAGESNDLFQNVFTKEGYVFAGWNTLATPTEQEVGKPYIDKANYQAEAEFASVTLYAQWLPTATIIYDGNGADSGSMGEQTIVAGIPQNLASNAFVRDNYVFNGWNTVKSPTPENPGTPYTNRATYSVSTVESQRLTLYAQWLPTATIIYDGNGADSGSMGEQTIVAGIPQNLASNAFVKDGYVLSGWNTVKSPTPENPGTPYTNRATYSVSTVESQRLTLYAQWKQGSYMQDVATWGSALEIGDEKIVTDSRDGKDYYVARLADNNIWMTQNLDLDILSGETYTSADTDLAYSSVGTTWVPSVSTSITSSWTDSYNIPSSYDPGDLYWDGNVESSSANGTLRDNTVNDPSATSGGAHYHVGNYYNWTAAVAMNDSSRYTAQHFDMSRSVCPAGWRLPNISGNKSYSNLVRSQYLIAGRNKGNVQNAPVYFVYGGNWNGSSSYVGFGGDYWSSVSISYWASDALSFHGYDSSDNPEPEQRSTRSNGYSLRCVAR